MTCVLALTTIHLLSEPRSMGVNRKGRDFVSYQVACPFSEALTAVIVQPQIPDMFLYVIRFPTQKNLYEKITNPAFNL